VAAAAVETGSLGFSYHRRLDAEILIHRRCFGHLEIMADHFLRAPRESWRLLSRLKTFLPVTAHAVGLSLGSAEGLDDAYLERLWDFLDFLRPAFFSEHLAFTRTGGRTLPHFAPLPRDVSALRALARNASLLRSGLPCPLLLENPAFPIDAGGWPEEEFLVRACDAAGADLLLDLHNLHANAVNRGFDAFAAIEALPVGRVREVHLAGGYKGKRWLVDSHTRPVPDAVFALLRRLRELGAAPLVTLEWDDEFPPMEEIAAQLDRARGSVAVGPARARSFSGAEIEGGDLAEFQNSFARAMIDGERGPLAGIPAADLRDYAAGMRRKAEKDAAAGLISS
jgi:uncharacterized protein (UPF0276 family)